MSRDLLGIADSKGAWVSVNPAWTRALGWEEPDIVGRTSEWLEHPDDRARTRAELESVVAGNPTVAFENRFRSRTGGYRLLSWTAVHEAGLLYCIARDVTEEREREKALRDQEDFTRLAMSAVGGVGAWTYDVATDRFTCDAAISDLYGIDARQGAAGIARQGFLANVHPDDLPALRATMSGGLERRGDLELEYRIRHPGGAIRWVLSRGHTNFDDRGRPYRRTGVGIETTKQRQFEEHLRQSQKIEAIGQLTGGLAHDFNNLLTGILGSLELMQTRISQGRLNDLERYLTAAQGASKRAASLTHRLLAFSRQQTLDQKPTRVQTLITGMLDLIRRTVGPAVAVETVFDADPWLVLCDPHQLENAVLNLCINARDAMPEGGAITITTGNVAELGSTGQPPNLPAGETVVVSVADSGTGMPPDVIARAFDPFFTTKPLGKGTGLGLSMVHGFVQQTGGQVRIRSTVGSGTTVSIHLPRYRGAAEASQTQTPSIGIAPAAPGKTVLIVDDEPTVRMLVLEVMQDMGCAAIEAADGISGLKVLQSDVHIDLLVTDVGLPGGMSGQQMVKAALTTRPGLHVLFITGHADGAAFEDGTAGSRIPTLIKPFAMNVLSRTIRDLLSAT